MVNPIHVNPSNAARHLTIGGSDWLWFVTTIMGLSTLAVFTWAKLVGLFCWHFSRHVFHLPKQPRGARAFHYIAVVVLTVSSIAYFAMASNLGQTSIRSEFRLGKGLSRSVFVCHFPSFSLFFTYSSRMNIVGAIHTVVYQCATHPPHVTADDRPPPIRPFLHPVHDTRHGSHGARRSAHSDIVQVGLLCLWRHNTPLRCVSIPRVIPPSICSLGLCQQLHADLQGAWIAPPCEEVFVRVCRGLHHIHLVTLPHLLGSL